MNQLLGMLLTCTQRYGFLPVYFITIQKGESRWNYLLYDDQNPHYYMKTYAIAYTVAPFSSICSLSPSLISPIDPTSSTFAPTS